MVALVYRYHHTPHFTLLFTPTFALLYLIQILRFFPYLLLYFSTYGTQDLLPLLPESVEIDAALTEELCRALEGYETRISGIEEEIGQLDECHERTKKVCICILHII